MARGQVKVCTPAASETGIRVGMRISGVTALCPQAILIEHDAQDCARVVQGAALALQQYTPEVALSEQDTLLLEVTASLQLFGGIRPLYRRVRLTLQGLGLSARYAIAPTAGGAWLLANAVAAPGLPRQRRCLRLETLVRRLDRLPSHALPVARPFDDWLQHIGCATLGALRRLPRAGLQRRTSKSLLVALDAAYGQAAELFDWFVPPLRFEGRIELLERIEYAQAVLGLARRLVEQVCGWLAAHQQAATHFLLSLEHERGRAARPPTLLTLVTGTPSRDPAHLMHLLQEHVHRLQLAAPVIALTLKVERAQALAPVPDDLFPMPGGAPEDRRRTLEVIVARLGHDKVLRPGPVADHRPEVANRWVSITQTETQTMLRASPQASDERRCFQGTVRPCWLLSEPLPLQVRSNRPCYGSPLHILQGPERIEDGWWEGWAMRDYFVAEDSAGARYWLFQERGARKGWFLHGFFG